MSSPHHSQPRETTKGPPRPLCEGPLPLYSPQDSAWYSIPTMGGSSQSESAAQAQVQAPRLDDLSHDLNPTRG